MLWLAIILMIITLLSSRYITQKRYVKRLDDNQILEDRFCVIDVRDYISAYRSPYPGAENIPLSYLRRTLNYRFDCQKEVLVVSNNVRGARMAAKVIRKKKNEPIYYVTSVL